MNMAQAIIVDADEPLSKVVYKIRSSGAGVLVVRNGEYVGMIDERQLAFAPKDASKAKCAKLAVKTPILHSDASLNQIVAAFFAGRFKTLPVMERKKISGTISRWDVLAELSISGQLSGYKVSQYMTTPVITIESAESVNKASSLMKEKNIRRLIVTTNGKISGIISWFDLSRMNFAKPQHAPKMRIKVSGERTPLSSFMRTSIETIDKDASLSEAIAKMLKQQVAALVVNDGQFPVGILTAKDIMEALMRKESSAKVTISGLHGFEEDAQDAYDESMVFVSKLGKSMDIEALNLHVKKTGRQYSVHGHIHGAQPILASASGWSLADAIRKCLSELSVQAGKAKGRTLDEKKKRGLYRAV